MNKELFKCIFSSICFVCGMILSLLPLPYFDSTSPAFIACILFGISLITIGAVSFFLHLKGHKIISKLQNKELTVLAHWQYSPFQFEGITKAILQDKATNISIVILLGILSWLIALGILFSNSPIATILCMAIIFLSCFICILCYILIQIHYHNKMLKPVEAIIGEDYIYFRGELYSLQKSLYLLTDIRIVESQDY